MTGSGVNRLRIGSSETADAVLQATTSIFTPRPTRWSVALMVYLTIDSTLFVP